MDYTTFKLKVQYLFPVKFAESLIYAEDTTWIDGIINQAIDKALSNYEKIGNMYVSSSIDIPEAVSIVKVNRTDGESHTYNVFDFWRPIPGSGQEKVRYYFNPERRLILETEGRQVYVEYVVDPTTLTVTDLNPTYIQWGIKYANALLKEKEGYIGTSAILTELPFEFNYADMKQQGIDLQDTLETDLVDMGAGTLAIRTN